QNALGLRAVRRSPPIKKSRSRGRSTADDQIDCFGALALVVGLDVEADTLSLVERLEACALHCRDVYEHVATAVIRLDEAVPALAVEELDRTGHSHREAPFPNVAPPPAPTARRLGRTFANGGKASAPRASVTPPAPKGGGTSKPATRK